MTGAFERWGMYAYAGYTFNKFVDLGTRYDWSENSEKSETKDSKISGIFTYRMSEATFAQAPVRIYARKQIKRSPAAVRVRHRAAYAPAAIKRRKNMKKMILIFGMSAFAAGGICR